MEKCEQEKELSNDTNLSQEERNKHKVNSDNLWAKGIEIKEQHRIKNNSIKSMARQLERNPDYYEYDSDVYKTDSDDHEDD
jgi:hypothetical protein